MTPDIVNDLTALVGLIAAGLSAIIISLVFFYIMNGFINESTVPSLTKVSFKLDLFSIINLWVAYFLLSIIIVYIYFYAPHTSDQYTYTISKGLSTTNIIIALFVVYLGRVYARVEGIDSGKAYFTTIVTFGFIRLFLSLGSIDTLWTINIENVSPLSFNDISNIYIEIHNMTPLISGTLLLCTIGEYVLSLIPRNPKAYISLMETIMNPNSGEILDSNKKIDSTFKSILIEKGIKQIKCVTRSLFIPEKVLEIICVSQIELAKSDIKVIKMPDYLIESNLFNVFNRLPSLDFILDRRSEKIRLFMERYRSRLPCIEPFVDIRMSNIGNLRFIIIEYLDGDKCIMILAEDIDSLGTSLGLYSNDPQEVEKYSIKFNNMWESGQPEEILY